MEKEKQYFVEGKHLFGRCTQLRYVSTLDTTGPARRYHLQSDEVYASFSAKKTVRGADSGDGHSVNVLKFVSHLGRERNFSQFCWKFKCFQKQNRSFVITSEPALRRCRNSSEVIKLYLVRDFRFS